ncbi:MAG: chemotaxis protein CheV [Gammaproteobacteria bacterium]|nr:chemotaxis protein CheV [Gammaproteobacteria bacterium]MCP5202310.1 chemotaxis protein CheV [Gammaproteobacteria bacterium]
MSSVMAGVDRLTRIAGQNRLELLLFRLDGGQQFGINVFKVREVLKCPQVRRIPQANPHVCGVMHTRGQTVTIIDLASVLGLPPLAANSDDFVIITEYNGRVQAYLVAQVERIVSLRWNEIHPPPHGIGNHNYLTAVVNIDDKLVEILDVERVLAEIVGVEEEVSEALRGKADDPHARPRHVFVADDSIVARKQITKVLDQLGVTYDVAENGREAWTMLKAAAEDESAPPMAARYGMIISDIEMPEMDGYTLTKAIKAHPAMRDLYVCLHTSLSGSFNHAMAESVGADKLVPKFVADDLAMVIRTQLEGEAAVHLPA